MAFKGATQRFRRMLANKVAAIEGLSVGGTDDENEIMGIINGEQEISGDITVSAEDTAQETFSIDGIDEGDIPAVDFEADIDELQITASVTGEDELTVNFYNDTGVEIVLGDGTEIFYQIFVL